jgi:hypothetical protein
VKEAEEEKKHTTFKEFCLTCPVCRENIGESRWFRFPLRRIIVSSLISCGSEKSGSDFTFNFGSESGCGLFLNINF